MRFSSDAKAPLLTASEATNVDLYDVISSEVEDALVETVKTLALTVPAPKYDPFFGLDRMGGPSPRLLERLTRHGDFRKYVSVLDAGGGLGGVARWLALRFGCRVVVLDPCRTPLAVGRRLSRRAHLAARVLSLAGSFDAVPARDGSFTQIWSVESLHHARDRHRALAELYRVLRPGSPIALQEIVRRDSAPQIGGIWRHGTTAEYLDALAAAGFGGIEHEDVTGERPENSPVIRSARTRFERALAERLSADDPWRQGAAIAAALEPICLGPDYSVMHFFARRPSTAPLSP